MDHVAESRPASPDEVADGANELFRGVDDELLNRLVALAVDLTSDDFWPRNLKFVAFATHGLDQDREVQLTTTGDGEDIRLLSRLHPQGEIRFQLAIEPFLQLA